MYIVPNSTLRLLSNVPLDKNYEHSVYFKNKSEQINTFMSYTKHTLIKNTYQRVGVGVCTVQRLADECYDCNYMMFQNTNYGNKWFYAFIKNVEYLNNASCTITFEIDVLQTWLFDMDLKECFVEREHSVTDVRGENLLPEPVELGEYVFSDYNKITTDFDDYYIIVGAMALTEGVVSSNVYDNILQGLTLFAFDAQTELSELRTFLGGYKETPENIVSMYLCPKSIVGAYDSNQPSVVGHSVLPSTKGWSKTVKVDTSTFDDFFGDYLPKNKKLLTYPYTYYHIDNNDGSSLKLRFEFFANQEVQLQFDATINIPVQISCRPVNYKNASKLNTEVITLGRFPLCSWSNDSYTTWVANNLTGLGMRLGTSVVTGAISAATGNAFGFASSFISGVHSALNYAIGEYQASIASDVIRGNYQNGSVNASHEMQTFYHGQAKITEDYARTIDDFFTRFGYRCCKNKIPNLCARPHWTYTKTRGCTLNGKIPSDDKDKISSIFNRGITFWNSIGEIGDYTLDNSPKE